MNEVDSLQLKGIIEITENSLPFYFARSGNSFVTIIYIAQYGQKSIRITLIFKYPDGRRNSQVYSLEKTDDYFETVQEMFIQTVVMQHSYFDQIPDILEKDLRGMTYDDIADWISSNTKIFDHYISD
ncbi:MAG: hypothetical protein ACFE95_09620 [Candidatus Hodarchaeota archaeon]